MDEETVYVETTGLPALPDGMFWRITRPNIIGMHEIQLRKKLIIGSTNLGYTQRSPETMHAEGIQRDARYLLRQYQGNSSGMKYVGDYPPKKLED